MLPERLAERYEVGPVIGRGVGSSVFRAHDTLLGRDAAVKTFRVEADPRAGRELRLLARMDHPGLVPVYDVEEHDGRAFVVMALLDGGSLASRLAEHGEAPEGLALADALRTGGTVAGALDHVHRAGVLHRAVAPGNVLYDDDGRAHLADFGVAFVADAPRITDTGLTVGTAPYLAPEQVRGERSGSRADVYALGLVLIEALTGRRAFPGDPLSSAQARLDRDPTVPDGLPTDLARLLAAMTAGDADRRPDAAGASVALRRALVQAEPATMPSVIVGPSVSAGPSMLGGLALTSGPAVTPRGSAARWASTRARLSSRGARGTPRATGTRGILVIAGLAASAVLAGTVALAGTGPVAEITADSARPAAIVPGGATVGVPDPNALALPPAPAAPPSNSPEPSEDADAAPVTTHAPRTEEAPARKAAAPARGTTTPSHTTKSTSTHSRPTSTTTPDEDDGSDDTPTKRPRPEGPVGGVLKGVGGLVDGVLGGGR